MIKKCIVGYSNVGENSINSMKREEMEIKAIKDDGIYSTFSFYNKYMPVSNVTKTALHYCKCEKYGSWETVYKDIFYINCPELGDVTLPYLCAEVQKKVADRIKIDAAKNDDAIWSTIKVEPCYDHFDVIYKKAYVYNDNMTIKWKPEFDEYVAADIKATTEAFKAIPRYLSSDCMVVNPGETLQGLEWLRRAGIKPGEEPMTAQELEIENTKRTLRRIQENSYYGLYPRHSGLTYAFDEKLKEDIKASLGLWKAKADLDIHSPSKELLNKVYGSHNKEEKEKKDMNVTLMVVPNGMNKEFVNKVKADFQSNTSRLFVASTDINFDGKYEPLKTKYDLFEHWIKTGKVDIVYFMLGFEKDPDVRAFESFVRGFTEAEVPGKIDIRISYQQDDILNDMNCLRTLYFDEADAKEDLGRAFDKVTEEVKMMRDVYGLDDEGLETIKNSKGRIDASEEFVMGKIMNTAFVSDEDTKPAKKGGKK